MTAPKPWAQRAALIDSTVRALHSQGLYPSWHRIGIAVGQPRFWSGEPDSWDRARTFKALGIKPVKGHGIYSPLPCLYPRDRQGRFTGRPRPI